MGIEKELISKVGFGESQSTEKMVINQYLRRGSWVERPFPQRVRLIHEDVSLARDERVNPWIRTPARWVITSERDAEDWGLTAENA